MFHDFFRALGSAFVAFDMFVSGLFGLGPAREEMPTPPAPAPLVSIPANSVDVQALQTQILELERQVREMEPKLGVAIPGGEAVFETALAARISSSDTSMTLIANALRDGTALSGYHCFTLDEGRSDREDVCGNVSGTAVSNLERGISPNTGTSTVSALKFPHRVGANVKITDFPLLQRLRNLANGAEQFPNRLFYQNGFHPCADSTVATTTICDKDYIDSVGSAGAADSALATKGLVEKATAPGSGLELSDRSRGYHGSARPHHRDLFRRIRRRQAAARLMC